MFSFKPFFEYLVQKRRIYNYHQFLLPFTACVSPLYKQAFIKRRQAYPDANIDNFGTLGLALFFHIVPVPHGRILLAMDEELCPERPWIILFSMK
jgi:hypothetical protein